MAGYFERGLFLGAAPLDDFLLWSPSVGRPGAVERTPSREPHHLRLLSTLHLGLRQDAHPLVVTSRENAARILGFDTSSTSAANTFEVRLEEPNQASAAAEELSRRLGKAGFSLTASGRARSETIGLEVRPWFDQDQGALRLLGVLRWVILVVTSSVIAVAALGLMSTLSLVVLEGRRKIAMLRAVGLRDRHLYGALAYQCSWIALAGLASGLALGAAASWGLLQIPGFAVGLSKMGVSDPKVMLRIEDLVAVALATWALFLVVAWWPAREACRIDPVRGLRG
ncbi:MAG: FtsX-like permease family protein [Acidobacteriota bacterium]|nr:FtsX-like permease family protein [Acidobacteriota bacterium]